MATPETVGRRALLQGALLALTAVPVATAAGTVYEVAPEPAETPIKAIFRRYNAAMHQHHAVMAATPAGKWTETARLSPFAATMMEAKRDMEDAVVTSVEDIALKAVVVTGYFAGPNHKLSREAMDFLEGVQ